MIYSLVIQCPPSKAESCILALEFAQAVLKKGHVINRVFFYGDGVELANANLLPPQDESDPHTLWRNFIETNSIDATVCIAAAARRGLFDQAECNRHGKLGVAIQKPFTLSGLGQLVEAAVFADKLVTFK